MASLLRSDNGRNDGGANLAGIGTYQPARTGATPEMRADAHGMSGRFAPYDPPATVTAFRYPPPGPVPTPESRSIRTHDSGLSGETKVASVYGSEKKEGEQVRSSNFGSGWKSSLAALAYLSILAGTGLCQATAHHRGKILHTL